MTDPIRLNDTICIPPAEYNIRFTRSRGPGGQNVNKVASRAELRFNLQHSRSLPADLKERARKALAGRLTRDGILVLSSDRYREQTRNRADVIARLRKILLEAFRQPRRRLPTTPPLAAHQRRLEAKRRRATLKQSRRSVAE